jgi:hypothetical protein
LWRSGWFAAGVAMAVAGQLLAGGPWLLAAYSFIRYATPDSLFVVDCFSALLLFVIFAGCIGAGLGLLRRNRGLGLGLIIGWAGGLAALVIAAILIFLFA